MAMFMTRPHTAWVAVASEIVFARSTVLEASPRMAKAMAPMVRK